MIGILIVGILYGFLASLIVLIPIVYSYNIFLDTKTFDEVWDLGYYAGVKDCSDGPYWKEISEELIKDEKDEKLNDQ